MFNIDKDKVPFDYKYSDEHDIHGEHRAVVSVINGVLEHNTMEDKDRYALISFILWSIPRWTDLKEADCREILAQSDYSEQHNQPTVDELIELRGYEGDYPFHEQNEDWSEEYELGVCDEGGMVYLGDGESMHIRYMDI